MQIPKIQCRCLPSCCRKKRLILRMETLFYDGLFYFQNCFSRGFYNVDYIRLSPIRLKMRKALFSSMLLNLFVRHLPYFADLRIPASHFKYSQLGFFPSAIILDTTFCGSLVIHVPTFFIKMSLIEYRQGSSVFCNFLQSINKAPLFGRPLIISPSVFLSNVIFFHLSPNLAHTSPTELFSVKGVQRP